MNAPGRILVRGVNWLGDAVMSTPALLRLRTAYPDAHIALLTPVKLADIWRHHPAIDAIMEFAPGESIFKLASRLRAAAFDTALILPNSPRSALEAYLAGIPRRVGAAFRWRNLFLTVRVPSRPEAVRMHKPSRREIERRIAKAARPSLSPQAHHVYHYLHLAAALGADPLPLAPAIAVMPPEVQAVRERFQVPSTPLLGLNPGAEYGPAKRWPEDRFVAVAVELHRRLGCHWWVFGGSRDVELASAIAHQINAAGAKAEAKPGLAARCLAGQTSLRELCAALSACDLVLTNDSGPMHLAAAVGTPVVVPFGSTSPELTKPGLPDDLPDLNAAASAVSYGGATQGQPIAAPRHQILRASAACSPCFLRVCPIDFRCMTEISVEKVVTAMIEALRR